MSTFQPLQTFEHLGVKFWEDQRKALDGVQEFADGWFKRRHAGTQAALEAAKRISEGATPLEMLGEYQNWAKDAMGRMVADGLAFQQQIMKAGALLNTHSLSSADGGVTAKPGAEAQTSNSLKAA